MVKKQKQVKAVSKKEITSMVKTAQNLSKTILNRSAEVIDAREKFKEVSSQLKALGKKSLSVGLKQKKKPLDQVLREVMKPGKVMKPASIVSAITKAGYGLVLTNTYAPASVGAKMRKLPNEFKHLGHSKWSYEPSQTKSRRGKKSKAV